MIGALKNNERVALDARELARWLTAQIQAHPGCAEIVVERVIRLDAPDNEGCNWSRTVVLNPNGRSPKYYGVPYAAVVAEARRRFTLK